MQKQQSIFVILFSATTIFGGLSLLLVNFPKPSPNYIGAGILLGVSGVILMICINYLQNLWIKGAVYLNLMILLTLITIRSYSFIFPDEKLVWTIVISASVVISFIIPMINESLTNLLRNELSSPQTPLGKKVYGLSIYLGPSLGVIAAIIGIQYAKDKDTFSLAATLGTLLWIIAIFLPFASHHPVTPFEKK